MSIPLLTIVQTINDATMLASALTPLVQQAMAAGQTEVSEADVQAARERLGSNIASLDAMIAQARTPAVQGSLV